MHFQFRSDGRRSRTIILGAGTSGTLLFTTHQNNGGTKQIVSLDSGNRYIKTELINPFEAPDKARIIWQELQERSARSFFTSWGWIGTWLKCLPAGTDVQLVVRYVNNMPACAFFLGLHQGVRNRFFSKRQGILNATGDKNFDSLMIEYNGPLLSSGVDIGSPIFRDPRLADIEEFHIPGIVATSPLGNLYDDSFYQYVVSSHPCFYIELAGIRDNQKDYLGSLVAKHAVRSGDRYDITRNSAV